MRNSREEKQLKQEHEVNQFINNLQRREEVDAQLTLIRTKQSDPRVNWNTDIDSLKDTKQFRRVQTLQQKTKFQPESTSFSRDDGGEDHKLDKSEVDTLITRVHEYYERMNEDDQDVFFDSTKYIAAEKYDHIGRDLNVSFHDRPYSPERVPLAQRNKDEFPKPMNLERRFKEKQQSPQKYR